jgi:predicted phosphodiesterase
MDVLSGKGKIISIPECNRKSIMAKIGIMSDIHGNLPALEKALKIFANQRAAHIYCAGDVVGYGSDPDACCRLVRSRVEVTVAGNHDHAACNLLDYRQTFGPSAMLGILYAQQVLGRKNKTWLGRLPLTYENDQLQLVHASLENPERFYYLRLDESPANADIYRRVGGCFDRMRRRVCFVGHTHVPVVYIENRKGEVSAESPAPTPIELKGRRAVVDVGSAGMLRTRADAGCVAIYDSGKDTVSYHFYRTHPVPLPDGIAEAYDWPDF